MAIAAAGFAQGMAHWRYSDMRVWRYDAVKQICGYNRAFLIPRMKSRLAWRLVREGREGRIHGVEAQSTL
jgi:hypothetical protein